MGKLLSFASWCAAGSASQTAYNTNEMRKIAERQEKECLKQKKIENSPEYQYTSMQLSFSKEAGEWIKIHPEDIQLISKMNKFFDKVRNLSLLDKLNTTIGKELNIEQDELKQEAEQRIPHLVVYSPALLIQTKGMKLAKIAKKIENF